MTCSDHDDGCAWSDDVVEERVDEVEDVDEREALVVAHQTRQILHHQHSVRHIRQDPPLPLSVVLLYSQHPITVTARMFSSYFICHSHGDKNTHTHTQKRQTTPPPQKKNKKKKQKNKNKKIWFGNYKIVYTKVLYWAK